MPSASQWLQNAALMGDQGALDPSMRAIDPVTGLPMDPSQMPQRPTIADYQAVPKKAANMDLATIVGKLSEANQGDLAGQKAGMVDLQKAIAEHEARGQRTPQNFSEVDLSPLLSLTDKWSGTNLAQGYQRPNSAADEKAAAEKLKLELQKRSGEYSKAQLEAAKDQFNAVLGIKKLEQEKSSAAAEKKDQNEWRGVERLTNDVQKAGLPDLLNSLHAVNDSVGIYKTGDVPGMGAVTRNIPDMFAKKEWLNNRQDIQSVVDTLFKMRSGSAVTDTEAKRNAKELGIALGQGPDQTRKALRKVNEFAKRITGLFETRDPNVIAKYKSSPGAITSDTFPSPSKAVAPPAGGRTPEEIQAEIDALTGSK